MFKLSCSDMKINRCNFEVTGATRDEVFAKMREHHESDHNDDPWDDAASLDRTMTEAIVETP